MKHLALVVLLLAGFMFSCGWHVREARDHRLVRGRWWWLSESIVSSAIFALVAGLLIIVAFADLGGAR